MSNSRGKNHERKSLHCNCTCPMWGKPHDNVYLTRCECGREEHACGYCLTAGRVTQCLACARKENKYPPERN